MQSRLARWTVNCRLVPKSRNLKEHQILEERFLTFAKNECKGNSSLYYELSTQIARDPDILDIAAATREGQPAPNILLGAVHYLLLNNPGEQLAKYYPSIHQNPPSTIPFDLFKAFCLTNEDAIRKIISTRIVQTNVIGRCAFLLPVFSKIIASEGRPTTIIDIGTSAGLTLNFDKYEYWYNGQKLFGESGVRVKSTILESPIPKIYPITRPIHKIGIDQNPVDPSDRDQITWLKALVWPDQTERFAAMDEALKLPELKNIKFIQADTVAKFERVIRATDPNQTLIIYATLVLYQFTQAERDEFYAMLERIGQTRDFYFLSVERLKSLLEKHHTTETVVELTSFKNKKKTVGFLAETNAHGKWIRWK